MFNRKLPLWYQLSQVIRGEILSGKVAAGERLMPEVRLAAKYRVSVITVRQALKSLEHEKLISRHRARGTFVNPIPAGHNELKLLGTAETVIAQQYGGENRLLSRALVAPPPAVAPAFGALRQVMLIRRLRHSSGAPLSYACNYVLPEYGARVSDEDLARFPMTKIWRDVLGLELGEVRLAVEAISADHELASLLRTDLLGPVLHFTGIVYGGDGRVIDVAEIYYHAARFKFMVDVDLTGGRAARPAHRARKESSVANAMSSHLQGLL